MNDSEQIIDIYKNGTKNTKKQYSKTYKNKNISKNNILNNNNKVPGLKLSRIEEFIEIGHGKKGMDLKERLLDTCFVKNIKHLILNKGDENNKDIDNENNMIGYTIDNKNNTIFKFNKSPNQLQLEQVMFKKEKSPQKKRNTDIFNFQNESIEKMDLNNISDNVNNINFLQKFKGYYPSEPEDNIGKNKKMKSNVTAVKKFKKELKTNKYKNTVMVKHYDLNTILGVDSKDKKKIKNKEKENYNQKDKLKPKREESRKIKDNNNQKEKAKIKRKDTNNNKEKEELNEGEYNYSNNKVMTIRRKHKSKTRKQSKLAFQINKEKKLVKINSDNVSNNKFIEKMEENKISLNNHNIMKKNENNTKKDSKNRIKSTNIRKSVKSCYFDNDKFGKSPKQKKSKRDKYFKFKSLLFPKKNSMFNPNNKNIIVNKKHSSNKIVKNEDDLESNSFYKEKQLKDTISSNSEEKEKINNNIKQEKNKNNIKIYKEDSIYSLKSDEINESKEKSRNNKLKDNKEFKNKYIIFNNSKCKIKHVSDLYVVGNKNKNEEYQNSIIKFPGFSVVQPDKLISFEFNRVYDRPKSTKIFSIKKSEDTLNENNIKNKNDNNDNEDSVNEIKKRNKNVFCCL